MLLWIVECNAAQNCSGQGICGPDGACECDVGLYMEDCSSKLKKCILFNYRENNCDAEKMFCVLGRGIIYSNREIEFFFETEN